MNEPIFTRYLYFKVEVANSLQWSILDKHLEESLYWAYEMYFSGFQTETFDFLLAFCSKYNNEIYKVLTSLRSGRESRGPSLQQAPQFFTQAH